MNLKMTPQTSHQDVFSNEDGGSIWITSFGEESLKSFTHKFMALESSGMDIIPIVISSFGGSAHNMQAMRDLIKTSNKRVAILALGKAMSAGAFLLAAGTKGLRFVAPSTSVMVHEVRGGGGGGKVSDVTVDVEEMKRINARILSNFAEDTGRPEAVWITDMEKRHKADWYLTPEEAVALGMADHITVPRMQMHPTTMELVSFVEPKKSEPQQGQQVTPKKKKPTKKKTR